MFSQCIGSNFSGRHLSVDFVSCLRGVDRLGTKVKMILKEVSNASFFICISNEVQRLTQYVHT